MNLRETGSRAEGKLGLGRKEGTHPLETPEKMFTIKTKISLHGQRRAKKNFPNSSSKVRDGI